MLIPLKRNGYDVRCPFGPDRIEVSVRFSRGFRCPQQTDILAQRTFVTSIRLAFAAPPNSYNAWSEIFENRNLHRPVLG